MGWVVRNVKVNRTKVESLLLFYYSLSSVNSSMNILGSSSGDRSELYTVLLTVGFIEICFYVVFRPSPVN